MLGNSVCPLVLGLVYQITPDLEELGSIPGSSMDVHFSTSSSDVQQNEINSSVFFGNHGQLDIGINN